MLLTLCMTLSLLPVPAGAVEIPSGSGLDKLGIRQISEKSYAITPDVKEYEWVLNNSALTQQMMGHVMEVKVGKDSKASVAVGYGDYNIEDIAGGKNWTMRPPQDQRCRRDQRRRLRYEQRPPRRCVHHGRHCDQPGDLYDLLDRHGGQCAYHERAGVQRRP